jgi:MoaA/NifB/PqqE/SkfB family radical SAM enzyme
MDGIGSVHDDIRHVKGGWQRLNESIQKTKEIRSAYGNVVIGLKTTVLPMNAGELDNIAQYAHDNELFTIISPFIITGNRYDNEELHTTLCFTADDVKKILAFFERPSFMWDYHREMLTTFFRQGRIAKPCSAGFNYFFVRSNGEVFPCPIIKEGLGNVVKDSFGELISCSKAKYFRQAVGRYEECRSCTEPGLERYALPFEGFCYLKMFFKMGSKRFLNLHEHMGLDKYTLAGAQ